MGEKNNSKLWQMAFVRKELWLIIDQETHLQIYRCEYTALIVQAAIATYINDDRFYSAMSWFTHDQTFKRLFKSISLQKQVESGIFSNMKVFEFNWLDSLNWQALYVRDSFWTPHRTCQMLPRFQKISRSKHSKNHFKELVSPFETSVITRSILDVIMIMIFSV